jgi:hypothetical protein
VSAAEAPDLGGQIRGCAWWIAEGEPATMQQASSRALENPAIGSYRFRALKVPLWAAGLPIRREGKLRRISVGKLEPLEAAHVN